MPNVFAADLFNEPWSASWASGNAGLDWDTAAERLGNHVLSLCSRWLIFVNGIANIGGACRQSCLSRIPGSSASYCGGCWWGENVVRHVTNPVTLSVPEKLVLSPHVYGHSWSTFGYLYVANFPTNMPAVWDSHFGHVSAATGTPIVIGEFGGVWTQTVFNGDTFEATAVWQQAFVDYLVARGFGFFYWTLNDNSFRTGSLFNPASGRQERLQMLSAANSTSISAVQNYWRAQAALMPPPPLPLPPSPSPPPLFRAAIQPPPITAPVPT
jgi:aryl-phospho-beta-D-glucosidase BglC (GH1 family)